MTTNDLLKVVQQLILYGDSFARQQLCDMYRDIGDENFATWLASQEEFQRCVVFFGDVEGGVDISMPCILQFDSQTALDIAQNFLANNAAFFTTYQEADQYYQREIGLDDEDEFDQYTDDEPGWANDPDYLEHDLYGNYWDQF